MQHEMEDDQKKEKDGCLAPPCSWYMLYACEADFAMSAA